jgi:hypothetical protein
VQPSSRPVFSDFKFGYASAEVEGAREPRLLLEGYYDNTGLIKQVIEGERFLFLGYKGSGKSAIGERLRLLAQNDPKLFVTSNFLSDFPYNSFKKVASGDIEPESRYPTAWAWLLLLRLVDSFRQDEGAESARDPKYIRAFKALETLGLLPITDVKQLVMTSSKRSFKAQIPQFLEAVLEKEFSAQDVALVQLVQFLRDLVKNFRSSSRHVLVLDGLDDILTQREVQYQSLAALVLEVSRLNDEFMRFKAPAKITLLCRTDLFESLPGANKNKMRRDSAVVLDWYHDTQAPEMSALVDLANLRASLTDGSPLNVFEEYFPETIKNVAAVKALLDLTRHTPRDFIQLLDCIQSFARQAPHMSGKLTHQQIVNGIRQYSIDYLLPEMKDELVGAGSPAEIEAIFNVISGLHSRHFKFGDLRAAALQSGSIAMRELDVESMLHALYERSAVGTVHTQMGCDVYSFKFRNRNSSLGLSGSLILHKGIWKAMNVV